MRRRLCLSVGVGIAVALFVGVWLTSHLWPLSTHHCQIRVQSPQYERDKDRMLKDYEQVVEIVEGWAGGAGFRRLPDDAQATRQRWFGSGVQGNERIVWFQQEQGTASDTSFPTEVLIVCDSDGPCEIQILAAEGYFRRPSKQLQGIRDTLVQRIESSCAAQVQGNIW